MRVEYRKEYSNHLGRDMEYKIYGHAGKICLVFPCQDSRFYDFENFGMIDVFVPDIEAGRIQLVCADGLDWEGLTNWDAPARNRIERHEAWFHYILEELVPRVKEENPQHEKLMTTGCSLGAYHAANFFFRAPDVFDTVVALSGLYHADYFFGDYMDDLVYLNSPIASLPNLPKNHPYMDLYHESNIIFCVGRGAWEDELLASTGRLDDILREREIPAWVDYWGYDVDHDWEWWKRQMRYFLDRLPF